MKSLFICIFILSLGAGWAHAEMIASMARLDAGVSNEYLVSLGTAADSFLISRLADKNNEKYYRATASYLRWKPTGEPRISTDVYKALTKFVATNISATGEVSDSLVDGLREALLAIGQRGGLAGVEYLKDWTTTDKYFNQVKCFDKWRSRQRVADFLRQGAVTGLGFSGSPEALAILNELAKDPPKTMFPGSFSSAVKDAINSDLLIQKNGDEMFFFQRHLQRK